MRYFSLIALASVVAFACSCNENPTEDNQPQLQIGTLPPLLTQAQTGYTFRHQFSLDNADSDKAYVWQVWAVDQLPTGVFGIDQHGSFEFTPERPDSGITFGFRVRVLLDRTERAAFEFSVIVADLDTVNLYLFAQNRWLHPGDDALVSVTKISREFDFSAIEVQIAYDPSVMTLKSAMLGQQLSICGWEYFTYQVINNPGACSNICRAMVRLIAVADFENGDNHPRCTVLPEMSQLFMITFATSRDTELIHQSTPLEFVWTDCSSNSIWHGNSGYDTLTVGTAVMASGWEYTESHQPYRVLRSDCDSSYTASLSGWCDRFESGCNADVIVDRIVFWNAEFQFDPE